MSTYWGYVCLDCNVETDHWHNHGEDLLREYYDLYKVVQDIPTKYSWVGITVLCNALAADEMQEFLSAHYGHHVAIRSEYGRTLEIAQEVSAHV